MDRNLKVTDSTYCLINVLSKNGTFPRFLSDMQGRAVKRQEFKLLRNGTNSPWKHSVSCAENLGQILHRTLRWKDLLTESQYRRLDPANKIPALISQRSSITRMSNITDKATSREYSRGVTPSGSRPRLLPWKSCTELRKAGQVRSSKSC